MKRRLLVVFSVLLICVANVNAQNQLDQTIAQLKTEIARREAIDHDESTPASLKLTNRENLEKARTALLNAVQSKIASLDKYLSTLGDSITPAEAQDARAELSKLADATKLADGSVTAPTLLRASNGLVAPKSTTVSVANPPVVESTPVVSTTPNNAGASATTVSTSSTVVQNGKKTAYTRSIIGIEQAAAASAKPEQKLFLEFNLSAPLSNKDSPMRAPVWLWINPRITSVPKQLTSSVAEFSTASNFIAPFNNGKVNEIAQGAEFLGGLEIKLTNPFKQRATGFGDETKVRFALSLVLAGGTSTPFGSQQVAPQFFKVNSTVKEAFNVPDGKEFIAFVAADRNRFFRQYYGGLRIKSYYVKKGANNDWEELDDIFPGIIDVTFGQNESVTGGGLHGGVVRIDGIYPLPFTRGVYAFGSVLMKLSRPKVPPPIILQPPDAQPAFPADNVFIQQVPPRDADHYRFGVGIDLIKMLKRN